MRLELSVRAARDIEKLYLYGVAQYGFRFTAQYTLELRQRLRQLIDTPFIGAPRDDVREGVRLLVFKAHNIPYRVSGETVLIIRILHRSAEWADLL